MFENYKATKKDFETIEEGIKAVWRKEMDFVFKNRNLIDNVVVISYDSKLLYLWTKLKLPELETIPCQIKDYYAYKIPHKVKIKDEWQLGWRAFLLNSQLGKLLPEKLQKSDFEIPKISGGLLKPFISLQKKKKVKSNPYITRESVIATIVHEFGHVYWNSKKLWWYSNKKENIHCLELAKQLYGKQIKISKTSFRLPIIQAFGEVFAFCTEYTASQLLWPNHKQNLDKFAKKRIEKLIKKEEKKDLEKEDSVLEPNKNPHDFAFIFGKIILQQSPYSWPKVLLKKLSKNLTLAV